MTPDARHTNAQLRAALDAIRRNAEAWHGDDAAKGRALAVIARWAADPGSIPEGVLEVRIAFSEGRSMYDPELPS